jgi:hypothetical protein
MGVREKRRPVPTPRWFLLPVQNGMYDGARGAWRALHRYVTLTRRLLQTERSAAGVYGGAFGGADGPGLRGGGMAAHGLCRRVLGMT